MQTLQVGQKNLANKSKANSFDCTLRNDLVKRTSANNTSDLSGDIEISVYGSFR